jgi:hypothetical protein
MAIPRSYIDEVMAETGCDFETALAELIATRADARLAIVNILNG